MTPTRFGRLSDSHGRALMEIEKLLMVDDEARKGALRRVLVDLLSVDQWSAI